MEDELFTYVDNPNLFSTFNGRKSLHAHYYITLLFLLKI